MPLSTAVVETLEELTRRAELNAANDGWWYRFGYAQGWRDGYDASERDTAAALEPVARHVRGTANEPTHAELERRRWGPGGREHFGDPRPGDFPGRERARRGAAYRARKAG